MGAMMTRGRFGGGQDRRQSPLHLPRPVSVTVSQAEHKRKVNIWKAAVGGEAPGQSVVGGSFCGVNVPNLF